MSVEHSSHPKPLHSTADMTSAIAEAVARAFEAQRKTQRSASWEEKHSDHHEALEQLLPHIGDLVSYIEVVKAREERRKQLFEKVTGAVVVAGALWFCGWIGKLLIEKLGS